MIYVKSSSIGIIDIQSIVFADVGLDLLWTRKTILWVQKTVDGGGNMS